MFNLFKKESNPEPTLKEFFVSHGGSTTNTFASDFDLNIHERWIIFKHDGKVVSVFTDLRSFYLVCEAINEAKN